MNITHCLYAAPLVITLALLPATAVHSATPAAELTRLSGFVMAVKPDGTLKLLSAQSAVEVGDTLLSERDSYVGLVLPDGRQAILGPNTRLKITGPAALALASGDLQVITNVLRAGAGELKIEAGGTTVQAGAASFNLSYRPDLQAAVAQRAYARASLALASGGIASDAGQPSPLWQTVAQLLPPPGAPRTGLPPGLYVHVIDGSINLSNKGGSQNFAAGQFGYTPSPIQPPVIVPRNPVIQFTPPPAFSAPPNSSSGGGKPQTVDCEVR